MEKKHQIFISSTYTDLIEARTKVRDAILSMYHFPVGMELFGAANEEQWQIISETIDSSDYYVLIVGQRYGSVISEGHADAGISYTEKEFRYALEKGVPILAFLLDDSVPVKPEYVERENPGKLAEFKDAVKTDRLVEWWKTPDELAQKVTTALYKQITRTKRPGWIRGDSVDIEKSLSEIIELSKQNRELQEENRKQAIEIERLKMSSKRVPLLTVTLGCTKPDEDEEYPELYQREDLLSIDENGTIHLKLKEISTSLEESEYHKLTLEDVPAELRKFVSDKEIREYNQNLPSEEELQRYIKSCKLYKRIKENGIPLTFFVNNLGNAKATDISVTIEFPDQVRVYDINEIGEMGELKGPAKPKNPIEAAKKQQEKERAFALDIKIPNVLGGIPAGIDYSAFTAKMPRLVKNSVFESIEIEDNIVEIEQKQGIVHTRLDYFNGSYIVPMTAGAYEAKVTLMCAEYEDPEETTIKFIVEE